MDPLSTVTACVFRELSRFGHGDHVFYHRTAGDPHSFIEVHADGTRSTFTSPAAALMPNVVIKLQTPMFAQIISAVKPQQGRAVIRDPHTRLYVADSLADIVGLVQNHRAAVLREGATLVSWSNEVPPALATLFQVQHEVSTLLAKYDPARAVDPAPLYGSGILEGISAMDCFDQFIHNYEPAASADKPHDFSLLAPMTGDSLPPLGTLDTVNSIDSILSSAIRPNLFDSLASTSTQSPMLSDSPNGHFMSTGVSRLHIHSVPQSPSFATLSPASMSYSFSSPSTSSGTTSDNVLDTPMTIAPSALSSPHLWSISPLSDTSSLPVILETPIEEPYQGTPMVEDSPSLPVEEIMDAPALPDSPIVDRIRELAASNHGNGKRKRTSAAAATPQGDLAPTPAADASGRTRSLRAVSPSAPSASESSRARKSAPSPKRSPPVPTPPAPKRTLCPLPGRTTISLRTATGGSAVSPPQAPKRTLLKMATAARLAAYRATTAACCDGDEHEHDHDHDHDDGSEKGYYESDADQDSEYEADQSSDGDFYELVDELDGDDDDDDEFRPPKRTRSSRYSPASFASSIATVVGPKAVSSKIAKGKKGKGKGKRKSKSEASKMAQKAVLGQGVAGAAIGVIAGPGKSGICKWCSRSFTRAGDCARHILSACRLSPFHQVNRCPKCFEVFSRHDALLRHSGSGRCPVNQRKNAKAAGEAAKEAARAKKAARKAAKKAEAEAEADEA